MKKPGLAVVNDPVVNANNYTLNQWLLTTDPKLFGLIPGCANPTGIALAVILFVMFICSQPFVRKSGSFEIFYWTHLLYIPFWILVLFHGPNFWKWFIVPGLIYVIERAIRLIWLRSERGKTYISSGILLPSKVTHLVIKRPTHFCFRPGDYVFVNIPAIAKYEWHPFTLSSAPEQDDYMWLHIRGVGEWTNRLYAYFEREHEKLHNGEIPPSNVPNSSTPIQKKRITDTPQKDFLVKNITKMQNQMHKSSSFDSQFNRNGNIKSIDSSEPNTPKISVKENPFNFNVNKSDIPMRPPRNTPGTSKLATENLSSPVNISSNSIPKFDRQLSENKAIKNIKA